MTPTIILLMNKHSLLRSVTTFHLSLPRNSSFFCGGWRLISGGAPRAGMHPLNDVCRHPVSFPDLSTHAGKVKDPGSQMYEAPLDEYCDIHMRYDMIVDAPQVRNARLPLIFVSL